MTDLMLRLAERDRIALYFMLGRRHPGLDRALAVLTHLGGAATTVCLSLLLILLGTPALAAAGRRAGLVLALSHLAVQVLKRSISRSRPVLPVGMASLAEAPDRFSFPSGHAAAALSVALGVAGALAAPLAGAVLLLALTVGLTRCYLGVHYPGDVLIGWLLALATDFALRYVL